MTELSDYIRCVSGPYEERLKAQISELSAKNRRLREALEALDAVFDFSVPVDAVCPLQVTDAAAVNAAFATARSALSEDGGGA